MTTSGADLARTSPPHAKSRDPVSRAKHQARRDGHRPGRVSTDHTEPSVLYKTELCRSFLETRSCRYGPRCQYAHGTGELRQVQRHPKYKSELCRSFHSTGTCPYGVRCRFIHNELVDTAKASLADSCTTPRTAAADSALIESLDAPVTLLTNEENHEDDIAETAMRMPLTHVQAIAGSVVDRPRLAFFRGLTADAPPTPRVEAAHGADEERETTTASDGGYDFVETRMADSFMRERSGSWGSISPPVSEAATSPSTSDDEGIEVLQPNYASARRNS